MKTILKFTDKVVDLINVIISILLFTLIVVVFLAALSRSFNFPVPWAIDVSLILFTWFSFLAIGLASYRGSHPKVDLLLEKFNEKTTRVISIIHNILIILFLALVLVYIVKYSIDNSMRQIIGLGIGYSWITSAGIVGISLMLYFEIISLVKLLIFSKDKEVLVE